MPPVIECCNLRKVFGETVAVDSLSLAVEQGEVFGFLGPNGAGKTTTIKMLLGLVYPTSGEARVLDRTPGDPAAMSRIGFLPEHFRFPPWLTAAGLLDFHGRLYGMSPAERQSRIPQLLEWVGLADRANTRIGKFSKGMSQRIGLAQALLNHPEVVFLDEPTSGLDPLGRREVRDIIYKLRDQGITIFLNSHLLSEVEITCTRLAIIKQGRAVCTGTLAELTGGALEVDIRVTGFSADMQEGLSRWGNVVWMDDARLRMQIEKEELLPEVARWLVEHGARLYELSPRRISLEELFIRALGEA